MHAKKKKLKVFITRDLARELVSTGTASSIFADLISDNTVRSVEYDYAWHIDINEVHMYYGTKRVTNDELARELMLLPTVQSREAYLNGI